MDRPEWVAAHSMKPEVYCCLTNNKNRGKKPNKGGDETPGRGGRTRGAGNLYGQIVRWRPDGGDHSRDRLRLGPLRGRGATRRFTSDANAGSANVNADNMFNSPDGLAFDSMGRIWIQTDRELLEQGRVRGAGGTTRCWWETRRRARSAASWWGHPKECEVTGFAWSADRKTVFVGIQHPGERGNSHFPDGGDTAPRSAIVAISPGRRGHRRLNPSSARNRKGGAPAPPFPRDIGLL